MAPSFLALLLGLLPSGEPLCFDWDGEPLPAGAIARLGSFRGREPQGLHQLAAYCPARNLLATAGNEPLIRLYDATTGQRLPGLSIEDAAVHALAFSPDGSRLAVASSTQIVLLDLRTGQKPRWLKDRTSTISGLLFSPDGRWLVALESREGVRVWQTATGKVWAYWKTPARRLYQAAFSRDGGILAVLTSGETEAEKGEIRFWEFGSGLEEKPVLVEPTARSFALWPDGRRLAVLASLYHLALIDRSRPSDLSTRNAYFKFGQCNLQLALSADGRALALDGLSRIRFCDPETGEVKSNQVIASRWAVPFSLFVYSPDDQTLRTWRPGDRLRILDASGKQVLPYQGHECPIQSLRLTPDGRRVISVDTSNKAHVWDCATFRETTRKESPPAQGKQEKLEPFLKNEKVAATAVSADGRLGAIAYSCEQEYWLEIWDLARKQQLPAPLIPRIRALAFSPDGHSLAIAGDEGVGLWELATGGLRRNFSGHIGPVNAVLFSADGRRLFTGGEDWTVLVWEVLPSVEPTPARPLELWHDLASDQPDRAFRAMSHLIREPRQALPPLRDQIAALRAADSRLPADQLIVRLSSDCCEEREQASAALQRLGSRARKDILAALQTRPSLDLERQLHRLLADIEGNYCTTDELRQLRVVEVLEQLGVAEAQEPLRTLATGVASERVGAAARAALVRLRQRADGSGTSASIR